MYDMQSLIIMLQSKNPDKRYDACEQLRVSSSISPDALDALQLATNDESPDVADAARRAIALHSQLSNHPIQETPRTTPNLSSNSIQISELENQITNLENHKVHLEKSISTSTIIAVAIGVFLCFFGLLGTIISSRLGISSLEEIQSFFLAIIPTIITVMILIDNGKKKDKEALEQKENEIQEIRNKNHSIK